VLQLATRTQAPCKPRPILPPENRIVTIRVGSRRLPLNDWLNDPATIGIFVPRSAKEFRPLRWRRPRFR
jgi:hypothetical protein